MPGYSQNTFIVCRLLLSWYDIYFRIRYTSSSFESQDVGLLCGPSDAVYTADAELTPDQSASLGRIIGPHVQVFTHIVPHRPLLMILDGRLESQSSPPRHTRSPGSRPRSRRRPRSPKNPTARAPSRRSQTPQDRQKRKPSPSPKLLASSTLARPSLKRNPKNPKLRQSK